MEGITTLQLLDRWRELKKIDTTKLSVDLVKSIDSDMFQTIKALDARTVASGIYLFYGQAVITKGSDINEVITLLTFHKERNGL